MISLRIGRSSIDSLSKISRGFWISNVHFSSSSKKAPLRKNTLFEFLLHKHHFSPKTVSEIAPVLIRIKNPQNCDSLLSFLNENGFSNHQLETIVKRWPNFLVCRLETNIKPKIKIFQDAGLTPREVSELISKDPWILHRINPRSLLNSHEHIKRHVERADEMGVDRTSKSFIHAVCVLSGMTDRTWDMKLQAFRDMGFSDDDILRVFRQSPVVFTMSIQKLMRINEILLASGKYKMSCVLSCPTSLCSSIDGWYKPRLQILEILESKKLILRWPTFSTLRRMSNIKFFEKFVAPHLEEVGNVYMANMSSNDRKKLETYCLNLKLD